MNFSRFWPKRKEKASFNKDLLNIDMFCQLTHMAALATSGQSRKELFARAAKLPYITARYFKEINFLTDKLRYDLPEACRIVGEKTKEAVPREILLRLSGNLASGESEADLLAREATVMGETYGSSYNQEIESLSKWSDAYAALIPAVAVVVVVSMISMMIYPVGEMFVLSITALSVMVAILGAWIMYRASPKEAKTHSLYPPSTEQRLARVLFTIMIPLAIVVSAILIYMNMDKGLIMIVAAVIIFPPGLVIMMDDRKIDKRDKDIASFLRSLGSVSKSIGSTLTDTLNKLDLNALGSLEPGARRLRNRLQAGIDTDMCWHRFITETGSEHVYRSMRIFRDGVKLGGDPHKVGGQSSNFAMKIALLRAKRRTTAMSFFWLGTALHATIAWLLIFIYEVVVTFTSIFDSMGVGDADGASALITSSLTMSFSGSDTRLLSFVVMAMMMTLTVSNAVAMKVTDGGHNYKYFFYLSIMMVITGVAFRFGPDVTAMVFNTLPDY